MNAPAGSETRPIRWGIFGTGWVASAFAEGLGYARDARLVGVASRSTLSATAFAQRFGIATAHGSYEALAADPEVDVIYVATPNEHHRDHCLLAIRAGKAVLCEKPFALDGTQAYEIIEAAREHDVFCMEAMWSRCSPAFKQALAQVRQGRLGPLLHLDAQLGFAKQPSPGNRLFEGAGAGALLDLGVYTLALAHAIFGSPTRISASRIRTAAGVDEHVDILLGYENGCSASLSASLATTLSNSARLHGREGVLELHAPLYFPERYSIVPVHGSGEPASIAPSAVRRFRQHPALRPTMDRLRGLRDRLRKDSQQVYPAGTGYTVEAEEVMRCLRAGAKESADVPLADTLAVMETIDHIRRAWIV